MAVSTTTNVLAAPVPSWPGVFGPSGTAYLLPLPNREEVFDWWFKPPRPELRPVLQPQLFTQSILQWTGWSHRKLAGVLDSSHPTVKALEQGKSRAREGDLFQRLNEVYDVIKRINLIAGNDETVVDHLLSTPDAAGVTPIALLSERRPADAYLAALEVNSPRRRESMMQTVWPAKTGEATIDLADESE